MMNIRFLGAGNLAEALIAGMTTGGKLDPSRIRILNRTDRQRLAALADQFGVIPARDLADLAEDADVLILAVKPHDAAGALDALRPHLAPATTLVSVLAGTSLAVLQRLLPSHTRLVRAMPNTPSRLGLGITPLAAAPGCPDDALARARSVFDYVGRTVLIHEDQFDAVTAISGSGPAYVYLLAEAMLDAAARLELPEDIARTLVNATLQGASAMLDRLPLSAAELRRQVTSPGGTTAAAIATMEAGRVPETIVTAIRNAAERARELAQASSAALQERER